MHRTLTIIIGSILLLFMICILACRRTDAGESGNSYIEKNAVGTKWIDQGGNIGAIDYFDQNNIHFKIFRYPNGGIFVINYTKDSLDMDWLKIDKGLSDSSLSE